MFMKVAAPDAANCVDIITMYLNRFSITIVLLLFSLSRRTIRTVGVRHARTIQREILNLLSRECEKSDDLRETEVTLDPKIEPLSLETIKNSR